MAEHSTIEWTDATWNPVTGCTIVSPGCTNCYAMRLAGTRLKNHPSRIGLTKPSKAGPVWTGEVRFNEKALLEPLKWKRPRMIFVCAHGDLFHESVPDEWIDRVFAVMALCPQHTFQVLTKRSARMLAYMTDPTTRDRLTDAVRAIGRAYDSKPHSAKRRIMTADDIVGWNAWATAGNLESGTHAWPLPNVWLGVSAERQQEADARIPDLLATPAAVRFVSAEPLLGPIDLQTDLRRYLDHGLSCRPGAIDWIITGGESGRGARPMHPDWARSIRDQCAAAGVAFLFKQWGAWGDFSDGFAGNAANIVLAPDGSKLGASTNNIDDMPDIDWRKHGGAWMVRVGKKRAGRLLDGVEHNGMPDASVRPIAATQRSREAVEA